MKHITTFLLMIGVSLMLNAQVMVAPTVRSSKRMPAFTDQQLSKLKATTTYFIIKDAEDYDPENIKKLIKEVWTVTPVEVATFSDFVNDKLYEHNDYSFVTISGLVIIITSKYGHDYLPYTFLELWMNTVNKKGKQTEQPYARIDLYPDYPTMTFMISGEAYKNTIFHWGKNSEYEGMTWMEYFYTKSEFYNYKWPVIKNYLSQVNECLVNATSKGFYADKTDADGISFLKTQPLYIPEYALTKTNILTKSQSKMDKSDLTAKYPYPVKFAKMSEICDMIDNSTDPIYYMVYARSNTDKFITVFNSATGKVVYHRYKPSGWNMKSGDLKELAKKIAKPPKK